MKVLADVRSLMPQRRLSTAEAYGIAERQAYRLLRRSGVTSGPVPIEVITDLPFMTVVTRRLVGPSGATQWIKPRWVVLLNGFEPEVRQKFSLAHEFKHILDHPFWRTAYGRLETQTEQLANERLCEFFAACLWMPRPWVKAAWCSGEQDVVVLAKRFEVSPQAMYIRLQQLGLLEPALSSRGTHNAYHRSAPALPLGLAA